ncbi:unnamed protein product [Mytilus edulis]|uniref:C2H2-type domain-containing protein n=1 Tax=Mytilus edulis TaxID=6550 RepID=A0A8S3SZW0_MYTED|nr:unnamed protein product [Mytilus edulis]
MVEKAVEGITELQKHLLRSNNQELARTDIAKEMNVNDVIITCDWAMKFLPRRYREGQMDWFAKRGINLHVSVSLALDYVPRKPDRVKVVDTIHDLDVTKNKYTITNITSFYNFRFESSHLRMTQAYNIGEGKLVTLKLSKNSVQLKVFNDWTELSLNDLITEGTEQASKQQKQSFICPMDGCIREFKNQIKLDQHLLQGSCEYKLEKGPLKDQQKFCMPKCCPIIMAQQQRKTDKHDYKSAKSEIVRSQLKTEILETIED